MFTSINVNYNIVGLHYKKQGISKHLWRFEKSKKKFEKKIINHSIIFIYLFILKLLMQSSGPFKLVKWC
jgi:hypothetical protein